MTPIWFAIHKSDRFTVELAKTLRLLADAKIK
jgi:hypothetical protein